MKSRHSINFDLLNSFGLQGRPIVRTFPPLIVSLRYTLYIYVCIYILKSPFPDYTIYIPWYIYLLQIIERNRRQKCILQRNNPTAAITPAAKMAFHKKSYKICLPSSGEYDGSGVASLNSKPTMSAPSGSGAIDADISEHLAVDIRNSNRNSSSISNGMGRSRSSMSGRWVQLDNRILI